MSRSVWHKLRESKSVSIEGLQLSDVLQGFQPARKPVPSRMSWLGPHPEGQTPVTPVNPVDNKPKLLDGVLGQPSAAAEIIEPDVKNISPLKEEGTI
jgi:hypothetical protein